MTLPGKGEFPDAWLAGCLTEAGLATDAQLSSLVPSDGVSLWQAVSAAGIARDDQIVSAVAKRFKFPEANLADAEATSACILPETDLTGAFGVAAELDRAIRGLQIEHRDSDVEQVLTISVGVAGWAPPGPADAVRVLALADAQLYAAKRSGRGRICGDSAWAGL